MRATHQNGIDGLKDATYCHPGFHYDRYEKWSERFLKHFERTVVNVDCDAANSTTTPAEIEVAALAQHFKAACRPGAWSNNLDEDAKLSKFVGAQHTNAMQTKGSNIGRCSIIDRGQVPESVCAMPIDGHL